MKLRAYYLALFFMIFSAQRVSAQEASYSQDLSVPEIQDGFVYEVTVERTITVSKILSFAALASPIKLTVSCGSVVLAESQPITFVSSLIGKPIKLSANFKYSPGTCDKTIFPTRLSAVGLESKSPGLSHKAVNLGRTASAYKADIENQLEKKAVNLVKAHSLMSSVSGSQESFHCLIVSFESDALIPIESVDEIKAEYRKLYGTFQKEAIQCPATGVLADRIATCSIAENKFTLFCVLYDRVVQEATWFTAAITEGEAIVARESDANIIAEINLLLDRIKKSKEAVESQFGA